MTKQVALANKTYARLRHAKRKDESFSQVIERLLEEAPKDPLSFIRGPKRTDIDWDDLERQIEADRDATLQDA